MADSTIAVTLPQNFFDVLSDIKDNTSKNSNNNNGRNADYSNNILNPSNETQKIAPEFNSTLRENYENIGKAFFKGGAGVFADLFFEKLASFERDKEYNKSNAKQLDNNKFVSNKQLLNNSNNGDNKKENSLFSLISSLLAGGAVALGMWLASKGTDIIGQAGEALIKTLGALKIFNAAAWSKRGQDLVKLFSKISKPFEWIGDLLSGTGKIGTAVGGAVKKIGNITASLFKVLSTASTKILSGILSKLKFIPIIGTAIGVYHAYLRLERGEYFKGLLELTAVIPGVGLPISLGLNLLLSLWDAKQNIGGVVGGIASTAGRSIVKLLASIAPKFLGFLGPVFKRLPLIGTLISFGNAFTNFSNGKVLSGILNIISGIATIFPGIGTAIAIGVDALNWFLTDSNTGINIKNTAVNTSVNIGKSLTSVFNWIINGVITAGKWLWNRINNSFGLLIDGVKNVYLSTVGIIHTVGNTFYNAFDWIINNINSGINVIWSNVTNIVSDIYNGLIIAGDWVWNNIANPIINFFTFIGNTVNNVWNFTKNASMKIYSGFALVINKVGANIKNVWNALGSAFNYVGDAIVSIVRNIEEFVINTARTAWDYTVGLVSDAKFPIENKNVTNMVRNLIPRINMTKQNEPEINIINDSGIITRPINANVKKTQINISAVTNDNAQVKAIRSVGESVDRLIKVTEEKPVASNTTINNQHINRAKGSNRSLPDPRLNYA